MGNTDTLHRNSCFSIPTSRIKFLLLVYIRDHSSNFYVGKRVVEMFDSTIGKCERA